MKYATPCAILALLLTTATLFAQRKADWTVDLTGNPQQIIFQQLSGVPIIQTDKAFIGIDPVAQKSVWTIERKSLSGLLDQGGTDLYNMVGSPFVVIRTSVIDGRTGTAILSKEKNNYKGIEDYEIIPALNSVLIRTTGSDNMIRLYLIDMANSAIKWQVEIAKKPMITGITQDANTKEQEEEQFDVPPYTSIVSTDKHLIYFYQKNLAVISPEGKLLWNQKENPAEVMLSPDESKVLIVKTLVTGVGNSPVKVRHLTRFRSNKMQAFDLKTGKEVWKDEIKTDQNIVWADPYPDFLTIVYKKGCNIYNYKTGEAYWKDDFDAKRIVEIAPNEQGYLVTFDAGYKTMQLSKTGAPLWKKPQIVESDDDEDDLPEDGSVDVYAYAKGKVLIDASRIRFKPAKGSGMKKWKMTLNPGSRIAYDETLQNIILLHENKVYIVNPDKNTTAARTLDITLKYAATFHTLEFRPNGYFLSSSNEFVSIDLIADKVAHQYYPAPFDAKGMLLGVLQTELAINQSILYRQSAYDAKQGKKKAAQSSVGLLPPGAGEHDVKRAKRSYLAADGMGFASSVMPPARFDAFSQSHDFAYYFTARAKNNVLVKVSKETGAEMDQLLLEGARPIYQVDDVQKRLYYVTKGTLSVFNMEGAVK